jgi:iron complex transport system ATP-binding protein
MSIQISNYSVGYRNIIATASHLEINRPSLIALIGENGSGKSTFLKSISGLIDPLEGAIKNQHPGSVYLAAGRNFSQNLTVVELLLLAQKDYQAHILEAKSNVDFNPVLASFGIADSANTKLSFLSDGQYQLAALAFCLQKDANLLLLDEPFSFLDYKNKKIVFNQLKKIVLEHNKNVIFSTHDISMLHLVDQVWLVENKKIKNATTTDIELLSTQHQI